jgi:hypothetical protein
MHSLKKAKGTFKGLAGECMARIVKTHIILTHFQQPEQAIKQLQHTYSKTQLEFLTKHWHTIDAIDSQNPIIYEIKTRCSQHSRRKPVLTSFCNYVLEKAKEIHIEPRLLKVIFEYNWKYELIEYKYSPRTAVVVEPTKYNKFRPKTENF